MGIIGDAIGKLFGTKLHLTEEMKRDILWELESAGGRLGITAEELAGRLLDNKGLLISDSDLEAWLALLEAHRQISRAVKTVGGESRAYFIIMQAGRHEIDVQPMASVSQIPR